MHSLSVSVKIRSSADPVNFRHTNSRQTRLAKILLYLLLIILWYLEICKNKVANLAVALMLILATAVHNAVT